MKGSRSGYVSGFDPRSIDGCALWLDAADRATLTLSGSNVTAWADKSGNGRNATAGAAATYSATDRALNFALSYYSFADFSFAVNSYFSFFLVERVQRAAGGNSVVMLGTDALVNNGSLHVSYFTTNSTSTRFGFFNNDLDATTVPAYTTAGAQPIRIWSFVFTASFRGIYLNGTLMASDTNNTQLSQWTTPYLGRAFSNNSNNYTGFIYEVLGFGGQITTAQRQQVEGYLARKWGLQSSISLLPMGHPYKFGTPGFVPTSIAGCQLWLDAADTSTLTLSGSNVTAWADKSPSNTTFSLIGGGTTTTATVSNLPMVQFAGTSLWNPTFSFPLATRSVFFLMTEVVHSDWRGLLSFASNGQNDFFSSNAYTITSRNTTNSNIEFSQNYTSGLLYVHNNGNGSTAIPFRLYGDVTSNTSAAIYVNGSNVYSTTTATQPQTSTGLTIAGRNGSASSGTLAVAEILLYNRTVTATERQQVEGYLAWKWGTRTPTLPATHPYVSIPPVLRPFAPVDVPGCALWLDAADSSTLTLSGSNVTQWRDKSGSNIVLSASSNFPTYGSGRINGVPALQFGTTSNRLEGAYTFATQTAVFVVYNTSNTTTFGRLVDIASNYYGNFSAPQVTTSPAVSADTLLWLGGASYPADALYTTLAPQTGPRIYSVQFNGTSSLIWRNGTSQTLLGSGFAGPATGTGLSIGGGYGNGQDAFSGTVGELIYYKAVLTTAQRQAIEGYLARKWGLQSSLSNPHPYRYSRPFGFTPTSIANCALWLDAADANSIVLSGSSVTQWNDKSGNGRNATATGTIPYTATINGVSALSFTGATSTYLRGSLSNSGTTATGFAVFVMNSSSHSNARILSVTASGQNDYSSALYAQIVGRDPVGYHTIRTVSSASTVSATLGNPALTSTAFTGSSNTIYLNGTAGSTVASTGNFGYSQYTIGTSPTEESIVYLNGSIGEILVFHASLTAAQRQQVEGYLAWKWGLQRSLPTGHPYQFGLPPLTAGFTPVAISGCGLWLDAADRTTLTLSGSNVTQWNDKSGNGRNASAQVAATYSSTSNAISFAGTNYYSFGNFSFAVGSYFSFFLVERLQSSSGKPHILGTDSTGANQGPHIRYNGTVNGTTNASAFRVGFYLNDLDAESNIAAFTTASAQPVRIWSLVFTTSFRGVYLNGTLIASDANNTTIVSWNTPLIGRSFGGDYYNGFLYEILGFGGQITTAQRQQVEGYLAHKWGLVANLPSNHPYRRIKP